MPIFDQGYQHWQGALTGHAWRWLAITRHGVRVMMKNRILRVLLLIAWLPAIALVVALSMWGLIEQRSSTIFGLVQNILPIEMLKEPAAFRSTIWTLAYSFFFQYQMFFIMLLVVVAGPGLISRDLRFNALPLYFARPLTRLDYFLGKLGVIGALVAAVAVGPALFAYVIGVCFSLDLSVVKDTYPVLLASIAYGSVITLSVGTLILAMSSLTRRSIYVGIAWAAMWIISGSVGPLMSGFHHESMRQELVERYMNQWLAENPPPPGVEMRGTMPIMRYDPGTQKMKAANAQPDEAEKANRWIRSWSEANQQAWNAAQSGDPDERRRDWRPLFSYVSNLERIQHLLLDTDSAWVKIGEAMNKAQGAMGGPFGRRRGGMNAPAPDDRQLANERVPQYPWQWSAGVLVVLMGISAWTLTRRVKSLDRLK